MKIVSAVRNRWGLMVAGVIAGVALSFLWLYQPVWGPKGLTASPRAEARYSTTVQAVIDTTGFGIGRTDTDVYRLSLTAPTFANLMVSEPVLAKAEEILGRPLDADVEALADGSAPLIKITVAGADPKRLNGVAVAVVTAFKDYIAEQQDANHVPEPVRMTIRGIGQPSRPLADTNRRAEVAVLVLLLPIVGAAVLSYRLETPRQPTQVVSVEAPRDAAGGEQAG